MSATIRRGLPLTLLFLALPSLAASSSGGEEEATSAEAEAVDEIEVVTDGSTVEEPESDAYSSEAGELREYSDSSEGDASAEAKTSGGSSSSKGLVSLNGSFLNADLDSKANTYGAGETATGDGYFAKVSSGGQLIWDIAFTSAGETVAHDVSVDEDDNAWVAVTSYFPDRATASQARCTVYKFDTSTGFLLGSRNIGAFSGIHECTRVYARDSDRHVWTAGHFGGAGWMIIGYGYGGANQRPHQSFYGGWNDVYEIVDVNEDIHGNLMMAINVDNGSDSDIAVMKYETGVFNLYNGDVRLDYGASGDEDVATGFVTSRRGLPHLAGITETALGQVELFHKQISVTTVQTRTEATRED